MSKSWYPPPSRPRSVDSGLKARSRRGAIAQHWWSERFIEVLESIGVSGRLARGRTYARKGQVIDVHLEPGAVTATVQGSRVRPYRVRIGITAFGKTEWAKVGAALADHAWYAAQLLAGQMPADIEDLFAEVGLSLFPARAADLSMDCSCPDWEVPCKHLAAVFYLLAESFDADPFAILAWRGRDRDELLETLNALRAGAVPADHLDSGEAAAPLADCLDTYYAMPAEVDRPTVPPTRPAALLDQLPDVEVTVRGAALVDILRPAYLALDPTCGAAGAARR